MSFASGPRTVSVPATSANLGPGYDTLGLALSLRDRLTAEVRESGLTIEIEGAGSESVPRDETHLVVSSMRAAFDAMGQHPAGLTLHCHNVIPHARGLGSSSAAIVGGLVLARALVEDGESLLSDAALFNLAASIEGHPDNVAPAFYGGLTISGHDDAGFYSVLSPVDPSITVVVFIPTDGVETKKARGMLPPSVPHAEAAANSGNAALLIAALAGQPDQLFRATGDYLHQKYRRPAMPASADLVDELRRDGIPAVISGAGPTVLAFTTNDRDELSSRCPAGWESLHLLIETRGAFVQA